MERTFWQKMIKFRGQLYREALATPKISIRYNYTLPASKLADDAKEWLRDFGVDTRLKLTGDTVLAIANRKIVGFLWYNTNTYDDDDVEVDIDIIWVAPEYRKTGLGKRMFERLIQQEEPTRIEIEALTPESKKLVKSLAKKFRQIDWEY
jgi:GNAT superfamily N-acetyltransferase